MSTNQEGPGGWVRESTPHDTDWTEDSEYGIAVGEWDDYSSDQADPTPTPPPPVAESVPESPAEPDRPTEADQADDATQPVVDSAPAEDHEPAAGEPEPELVSEPEPDLVPEPEPTAELEPAAEPEPAESVPELLAVEDLDARGVEEQVRPRPAVFTTEPSPVDEVPAEDSDEPAPAISGASFGRPASEPISPEPEPEAESPKGDPAMAAGPVVHEIAQTDIAQPEIAQTEDLHPLVDAPFAAVDQMGIADDELDAVPAWDERNQAEEAMAQETQQIDGLFREPVAEPTAVIDPAIQQRLEDERLEDERRASQFQALREERDARLGVVSTSQENASRPIQPKQKLVTDKFLGSFGLFVLRLIVVSIVGVASYQVLSNVDATAEFLGRTMLPEPRLVAWIVGFALGGIAVLLVIGLLVRVAAFLLLVISVGSLAFVRWGAFSVFVPGMEGFLGDRDLLLAGVSLLLLCLGGGRWGVDGAFRAARASAREAAQA